MTTLILLIIAILILWPVSRYAIYLLSNHRAGHLPFIRSQLGGLTRPVLRGMITATAAEAIALPSYPLGYLAPPPRVDSGVPILLIHGLFHNSSAWLIFRERLREAGYENVHTYQYNSFTRDITEAVAGAQAALDAIVAGRPDCKVVLIGHSLGGLVSRCVAGKPEYRNHIAALVTLGSPHKGSELAWFGGNRMSRGLIPGRHISRLVEQAVDPDCPKLSIYSLADDFVIPLDMLWVGRPGWEEKVCSPMGHVWMLYSREVFGMALEFLRPVLGAGEEKGR